MPDRNDAALSFLRTRRSTPAKTLTAPYPDRVTLEGLLEIGARSPDHGKLEPWRFIVIEGAACQRIGGIVGEIGAEKGIEADQLAKSRSAFDDAGCIVAVIASPRESPKIPLAEQHASAAAVCLSLLNAALAAGWGANWLTGWTATDADFLKAAFGIEAPEYVAGYIHLGNPRATPPERPRPDVPSITTWISD